MDAVKKSDIGLKRKNNEDTAYISDQNCVLKNLYIVADGMGGHNAGEVASSTAVNIFLEYVSNHTNEYLEKGDILDLIVGAVQYSNQAVFEKASNDESLSGMGTTFLVGVIEEEKLYIGHVGDSRLYIFRNDVLKQITKDHSYVMELVKQGKMSKEEAEVHPGRNIITRALGTADKVDIDTMIEKIEAGDQILMCSDGLSTMVPEEEMIKILELDLSLEEKAQALIKLANINGGVDNISVILIS